VLIIFITVIILLFMHISIADDLKKRFHSVCALRGLKMSQVVAELIEQWLKTNEASYSEVDKSVVRRQKVAKL
jgi:hypothetical protein